MTGFWAGFEKKADATWLATGLSRVGGALRGAGNAVAKTVTAPVKKYQEAAHDQRWMRRAAIGTIGTTGALYGLDRLANRGMQGMEGPPRGQGPTGPTV